MYLSSTRTALKRSSAAQCRLRRENPLHLERGGTVCFRVRLGHVSRSGRKNRLRLLHGSEIGLERFVLAFNRVHRRISNVARRLQKKLQRVRKGREERRRRRIRREKEEKGNEEKQDGKLFAEVDERRAVPSAFVVRCCYSSLSAVAVCRWSCIESSFSSSPAD